MLVADLIGFDPEVVVQGGDEHGYLRGFCQPFHVGGVLWCRGDAEMQAGRILLEIRFHLHEIAIDAVC